MIKKHLIAGSVGLISFCAYCTLLIQSPAPLRAEHGLIAAGVLLGTLTAASCFFLAVEVSIHRATYLGKLRDERSALLAGLWFTFAIGTFAVAKVFVDLIGALPTEQERLWIHNSWGVNGKCGKPLKIEPGPTKMELTVETGGERYSRRLLEPPTDKVAKTEVGNFELSEQGTMVSTVQGYKGIRFTKCAR